MEPIYLLTDGALRKAWTQGGDLDAQRDGLDFAPLAAATPSGMQTLLVIVGEAHELTTIADRVRTLVTSGAVQIETNGIQTILEQVVEEG